MQTRDLLKYGPNSLPAHAQDFISTGTRCRHRGKDWWTHSSGHDIGLENGTGLHSWIRKLKSILITIDLENNYEDEHLQYKLSLQYCPSGLLPSTYSYLEKNIIGGGTNKVLMPAELFYLQLRTFFSFTVFKTVLKRRWQSK